MTAPQLILFGLDGADWTLLDPWIAAGHLPTLAALRSHGVSAGMTAPLPLNSIASWTTLATGVRADRHGLYGFLKHVPNSYTRRPVTAMDVTWPTLWDQLGKHGLSTTVINWPNTYPPAPINGAMVSGILIPYNDAFAYPPQLEKELRALSGRYLVDVTWQGVSTGDTYPDDFIDQLFHMTMKREEAIDLCMSTYSGDVLLCIFTGTDRIMHSFWRFMDPQHPQYAPEAGDAWGTAIRDYYMLLDRVMARVLERWTDDATTTMVVSDHGFGPVYHEFNIVPWLIDKGYLTLTPTADGVGSIEDAIDWDKTRAYPGTVSESSVRINLSGREPRGIVAPGKEYETLCARVTEELLALTDPDAQQQCVASVVRATDEWGPDAPADAPDLIVLPSPTYEMNDDWKTREVFNRTPTGAAGHHRTGIWCARGAGFKTNAHVPDISAQSVLPTILAALDVPVPDHVDGAVHRDAFVREPPVRFETSDQPASRRSAEPADADSEAVKERLRGLGYL